MDLKEIDKKDKSNSMEYVFALSIAGFVKPKPPEYPTAYGYHSTQPTYPMYPSYSAPAYNQPHHYNNLDYYNNDKLRYSSFYSPHHHPHQVDKELVNSFGVPLFAAIWKINEIYVSHFFLEPSKAI